MLNGFTATLNTMSAAAQKHPKVAGDVATGAVDATLGAIGSALFKASSSAALKVGMPGTAAVLSAGATAVATAGVALMLRSMTDAIAQALTGMSLTKLEEKIPGYKAIEREANRLTHGWLGYDPDAKPSGVHKESYITGQSGSTMQPINVSLMIDGRTLAQIMTSHQAKLSRPGVQTGTNAFDTLANPTPAGLRTA